MAYIKNKDMYAEWMISKDEDRVSAKLELMFIRLVKEISKGKFRYQREEDRYDCEQTAYLHLFSHWRNFNPEKSKNAFAYATEIVKRAFAAQWRGLYMKKGDPDNYHSVISMDQANDGQGIYNL